MNLAVYLNDSVGFKVEDDGKYILSMSSVAHNYGVTVTTVRTHKKEHKDELLEGKHWIMKEVSTSGGKQKAVHWTLEGVYMLGFFIKSKEAKTFRKYVATLLAELEKGNLGLITKKEVDAIKRGYQSALAKKDKVIAELRAELKLLPAPKSGHEPFEFNALLNVMSQGEKAIKTIEEEMGNMKMMFDRLYKGQPKYNVMGVIR